MIPQPQTISPFLPLLSWSTRDLNKDCYIFCLNVE